MIAFVGYGLGSLCGVSQAPRHLGAAHAISGDPDRNMFAGGMASMAAVFWC